MNKLLIIMLILASLITGADVAFRVVAAMETAAASQQCTEPDDSEDEWIEPAEVVFHV